MACKYKYKGKWYSEDEIKSIVGEEHFNKELYQIKEYEGSTKNNSHFEPVRNLSIRKIFGDDLESMLYAYKDIKVRIGNIVYIGSNLTEGFQRKDAINKKYGESKGIELVYVPETINNAVNKVYGHIRKTLAKYDALIKEGNELTAKQTEEYQAYNHLRSFKNLSSMVSIMYPESEILTKEKEEVSEDRLNDLATISPDIQESDRLDREKSQSKYVKLLTSFIEYDIDTENDKQVSSIIKSDRFVYKVLLDTLSKPLDTTNLAEQISEGFNTLIDTKYEGIPADAPPRIRKIYGVYYKLLNLINSQNNFINDITYDEENIENDEPVLRNLTFNNEDEFLYDPRFNTEETRIPLHKVNKAKRYSGIKKLKRNTGETTLSFLRRIQKEVNSNENVETPISLEKLRNSWLFHYNKWILQDTISLLISQRDNSPFIYKTDGKFGEINVKKQLQSSGISSYSLKSVLTNNMSNFFKTKEDIEKFRKEYWAPIRKNLVNIKSTKQQEIGVRVFIGHIMKEIITEELYGEDVLIRDAASSIVYLVDNFLNNVEVDEKYLAEKEIANEDEFGDDKNPVTSYDVITENANSLLNILSEMMEGEGEFNIAPMARAADGTSYHPYSNSSYVENLHDIIYFSDEGLLMRQEPIHFANIRPYNAIANKRLKIGRLQTYKGDKYYSRGIVYKNEQANHWFIREFSGGFIDGVLKQRKDGKIGYDHFYAPISNKPNIKAFRIDLQNKENILQSIDDIRNVIITRNKSLEKVIKNFKADDTTLFNVFSRKKTNEQIYKELIDKSIDSAMEFVLINELHISKNISKVDSLLSREFITDEFRKDIFEQLAKRPDISSEIKKRGYLSKIGGDFNFGSKEINNQNEASKTYDLTIDKFISVYSLYFLNHYVNSFTIAHAFTGDPAFYKDENDFIKRLSGGFSPGSSMLVNPDYGIVETFNTLIVKEDETSKSILRELFDSVLSELNEKEREEFLSNFPKTFDRSDAQGFVLEKRVYDLQEGLGPSFGQGTAIKGQLFTNRKESINGKTSIIPTMLKYASIGLKNNDVYLSKFPKAKKLIRFMMDNNIDEIIVESGIKVGGPQKQHMYSIDDILELNESSAEWTELLDKDTERDINGDKRFSLLTLPNADYRVQQNPNTNKQQNKKINTFTQALYVVNIAANGNEQLTEQIYDSFAEIYKLQSEELYNSLTNSTVSSSFLNKVLSKKLVGENNDIFGYFLEKGINVNFPAFYQKATIMFASSISDDILSVPFEGGKFQLISDKLFDNSERKRLEFKLDKEGNLYGEVLVPKRFADRFPLNASMFINGFTIRIPTSGLHSTMPFKVVGYIDEDSDVFVGPAEMVPVQGSDFDADAVFVVRDITIDDFLRRVSKKLNKKFYPTFKTSIENHYGDDIKNLFAYKGSNFQEQEDVINDIFEILPSDIKEEDRKEITNQISIFYNKQKIVKNMKTILSDGSKKNKFEILSPINMGIINGDTNSAYEYIAKERNLPISSLKSNMDLGDPMYKYAYYKRNFDGNALTGIFANLFKAIAYSDKAGPEGTRPILQYAEDETDENKLFIGDREFNQMQESTSFLGKDIYVRSLMDTLINLAIDNVKEQGLPTINASSNTAAAYVMGLSLGIPLEDLIGLMISPMGERISFLRSVGKVKKELISLIKEDVDYDTINTDIPITRELLKKQISYNKKNFKGLTQQELKEQLSLIKFYSKLNNVAEPINDLSRYLYVLQDMHVNFKDIDDITSYFNNKTVDWNDKTNASSIEMYEEGPNAYRFNLNGAARVKILMPDFYKVNPHIFYAVTAQKMMHKYLTETLLIYTQDKKINSKFNSLQSNLSNGVEKDRKDYVRKEFMHFIASTVDELKPIFEYKGRRRHPEYNFPLTAIDSWAFDLADRLEKVILKNRQDSLTENSNIFISHLQINKKAGSAERVISFSNPAKSNTFFFLHRDFEALPATLQRDITLYAIMFNGAKFGTSNFVLAIPPAAYTNFSKEYLVAINKVINGSEDYKQSLLDRFEVQMMINSTSYVSSFSSKVLKIDINSSLTLTNGNQFYYDMYHDNKAKPDLFQVDNQQEGQGEEETMDPDEVSTVDLLKQQSGEEEIQSDQRLLKGNNSKYVVTKNRKNRYTLFRRIDSVDIGMLPEDMRNNTYYKRVASINRSKYYTFNSPETVFDIEQAFSPKFPSQAISLEQLTSTEPFVVNSYLEPKYKKGQNVIGYSNLNPERMDGVTLVVKDIKKNNVNNTFDITFSVSNNSLPLFDVESYNRPSNDNNNANIAKMIALVGGAAQILDGLTNIGIIDTFCK